MQKVKNLIPILSIIILLVSCNIKEPRKITDFNENWKFLLSDDSLAFSPKYNDTAWHILNLPHDWSIEGEFSEENTTGQAGGGLPAGIGWYRKSFYMPEKAKNKTTLIEFGGIYRNSEVWINGHNLGKRPNGYISFVYELSGHLNYGDKINTIAIKVDNSLQPNSRWYTGSGIYRSVKLITTGSVAVDTWGSFVTCSNISDNKATITNDITIFNYAGRTKEVTVETKILNEDYKEVAHSEPQKVNIFDKEVISQKITLNNPKLWSIEEPNLYKAVTTVFENGKPIDIFKTNFGVRYFNFDAEKGFSLNGKPMKIKGVCNHHDLGALGAAVYPRAIERQLEILKEMGCNAIRTAHNPTATELLDLCDKMGFLVYDEAFDSWKKKKAKKDYHLDWDQWHKRDLQDLIKRDRNHPSIIIWSIGNEIREQFDSTGIEITKELVKIVKDLDTTRPVTCALTENIPEKNFIYQSGALDLLSFNYKQNDYKKFPKLYPGEPIIASENMSAFATRGCYNMPSDSIQRWPEAYNIPIKNPNPDFTVSAYDHVSAYWGSTHEETWKVVKNLNFISGLFIWSGFDFIGEPVPYDWPARSSYYGIIDLAGFPKDAYYMYQSEWTNEPMLHVFPHWNWTPGQTVDVWAYYNQADEAELFVNGKSKGIKHKNDSVFHVMWRVDFEPGIIKVVTRKNHKTIMKKTITTAGDPSTIELIADKTKINADGYDLCYVTVNILDNNGVLVPYADNLINFSIEGNGTIVGIDNGYQANLSSFKSKIINAFKGKCVVIIKSENQKGNIILKANSEKLESKIINLKCI